MRPRPYTEILLALRKLQCEVIHEDDQELMLAKGNMYLKALPKAERVAVEIQRRILRTFYISESDFLDAIYTCVN